MAEVKMYTTTYCGYCTRAKQLLSAKGVPVNEIDVTHSEALQKEMQELSGRRTVPQIFINGQHVGGCDDLYELDKTGELDTLLSD